MIGPIKAKAADSARLLRGIGTTAIAQICVIGSVFFQYWFIRHYWSINDLGEYSQVMRVCGVLEWVVLLVLPVALTRELANRLSEPGPANRRTFIRTGLALGALFLGLWVGMLMAFPRQGAVFLFGNERFEIWIPPFCVLLSGHALCLMVSSIARGIMAFHLANWMQFLYAAAFPAFLLLAGRDIEVKQIVILLGAGATSLAIFVYLAFFRRDPAPDAAGSTQGGELSHRSAAATLLAYGTPRLATMACIGVQSLILPWLVNRQGGSQVLVALNSLLGIIAASTILVAPLGLVMLPHLSRLKAIGAKEEAGRHMSKILTYAILLGGAESLAALALLHPVITLWLGAEIARYSPLLVACALAIPGFLVMEVMRNPLDAVSAVPWNAITYGCGAMSTMALFGAARYWLNCTLDMAAALGMAGGISIAAAICLLVGRHFYSIKITDACVLKSAVVWLGGVLVLTAGYAWMAPLPRSAAGIVVVVVYMAVLARYSPAWITDMAPARLRPCFEKMRRK